MNSIFKYQQRDQKGFTLIELMVVVAIIAILSVTGVALYSIAISKATTTKINADLKLMEKAIDVARVSQDKAFGKITGSWCSSCSCRVSAGVNDVRTDAPCTTVINTNWAKISSGPVPLDPYGNPYIWDENEEESGDCTGAGANKDYLFSAGPDHKTGGAGAPENNDNVGYYMYKIHCP